MKNALLRLFPAAAVLLASCYMKPELGDSDALQPVPASGERIWIMPSVNNSQIDAIVTWPRDTLERKTLLDKFGETEKRLKSEFEHREKLGLYAIVDDSAQATMHVRLTFSHARLIEDTLTMPVNLHVEAPSSGRVYDYAFTPRAVVSRGKGEINPFHYTGVLLAEYRNSFPYREMVYLFYARSR